MAEATATFKDIPELFEVTVSCTLHVPLLTGRPQVDLGESLTARTESLSTFRELEPPDLCHVVKSSGKTRTNAWFFKTPAWKVRNGCYCCFNTFSWVDFCVGVKIPGGVNAYVVDLRSRQRGHPQDVTGNSTLLRAVLYLDDHTLNSLDTYRKLDPITSPKAGPPTSTSLPRASTTGTTYLVFLLRVLHSRSHFEFKGLRSSCRRSSDFFTHDVPAVVGASCPPRRARRAPGPPRHTPPPPPSRPPPPASYIPHPSSPPPPPIPPLHSPSKPPPTPPTRTTSASARLWDWGWGSDWSPLRPSRARRPASSPWAAAGPTSAMAEGDFDIGRIPEIGREMGGCGASPSSSSFEDAGQGGYEGGGEGDGGADEGMGMGKDFGDGVRRDDGGVGVLRRLGLLRHSTPTWAARVPAVTGSILSHYNKLKSSTNRLTKPESRTRAYATFQKFPTDVACGHEREVIDNGGLAVEVARKRSGAPDGDEVIVTSKTSRIPAGFIKKFPISKLGSVADPWPRVLDPRVGFPTSIPTGQPAPQQGTISPAETQRHAPSSSPVQGGWHASVSVLRTHSHSQLQSHSYKRATASPAHTPAQALGGGDGGGGSAAETVSFRIVLAITSTGAGPVRDQAIPGKKDDMKLRRHTESEGRTEELEAVGELCGIFEDAAEAELAAAAEHCAAAELGPSAEFTGAIEDCGRPESEVVSGGVRDEVTELGPTVEFCWADCRKCLMFVKKAFQESRKMGDNIPTRCPAHEWGQCASGRNSGGQVNNWTEVAKSNRDSESDEAGANQKHYHSTGYLSPAPASSARHPSEVIGFHPDESSRRMAL
ncbi:Chs5p-Arf1p-binding proteins-domain-containing protein [Mycena galericulata]|nr:Chs5p-Arf1p-binding proteins-domain-containing protein [Mycena galericulata]